MQKSAKLSFGGIEGPCSNFIGFVYFLESGSPDISALFETNVDDSIDSRIFFLEDSIACIQSLAVFMKEILLLAWDLFLENLGFSVCLCSNWKPSFLPRRVRVRWWRQ